MNTINIKGYARSRWLRALVVVVLVLAGYAVATPKAAAQNVPVTTMNGTLPDGMAWRITVPSGWNGTLLLDLDFVTGGVTGSYIPLYNRGFAVAGVQRIAFNLGGRDSRVSAAELMQVLDVFTQQYGKPLFSLMYGGSTGGVVSGYTLEHYPDRVDGAIANCTGPGYIPYLNPRLGSLFAAEVLFNINLPIVRSPGTNNSGDAAAWRSAIDAAQATPQGKARVALALALGQMNSWTSTTVPAPDVNDLDQVQAAMYNTLRNQYANDVPTRRNQELQVGGQAFNWTTGLDYTSIFNKNIRPEQKAAILKFYQLAGLSLQDDLQKINNAPRIAADPAAVAEIHLHGDYSGNPQKPFLMNNLIGDPLLQPSANQGYVDRAIKNGKGELVRLIHVEGAGHCAFRDNERVAAVEVLNERVRTGVWPSTSAADLNLRAGAINPALVPRFVEYQNPEFTGGLWTGEAYHITNCADLSAAKLALGSRTGDPRFLPAADVDKNGIINILDIAALSRQIPTGTVCK